MAAGQAPKTKRGAATRQAILKAAEKVIGGRGFNDASISDITREAGVGQGTFYIYFKSKDEVFEELVLEMGRLLRQELSSATRKATDRVEAERFGLRGFLEFVGRHPELYRIVEEAQFVNPSAYKAYFVTFAEAYRKALDEALAAGEIRGGDNEVRAWALMGIAKILGERFILWGDARHADKVVDAAFDLISNGLRE